MRGCGDGEMRNGLGKQEPPEAVSHPLISTLHTHRLSQYASSGTSTSSEIASGPRSRL